MEIKIIKNHGRWLAICPRHPEGGIMEIEDGGEFICPIEYPGIIAIRPTLRDGRIAFEADNQARRAARAKAEQDGAIHKITIPDDDKKINKESSAAMKRKSDKNR